MHENVIYCFAIFAILIYLILKHSLSGKSRKPSKKKKLRDVKVACGHICSNLLSIVSLNRFRWCRQVKCD